MSQRMQEDEARIQVDATRLQHDQAIERVLAGLSAAEAPAGMERRISARVEALAAARSGAQERWWGARRGWGLRLGLGLAAALAAVGILSVRPAHETPPPVVQVSRAPGLEAGPGVGLGRQPTVSRTAAPPTPRRRRVLRRGDGTVRESAGPAQRAVSFPAPAAPLTAEEKLLRRVARKGDPLDFELLNPEAVEREIARNDAEFEEFVRGTQGVLNP